MKFGFRKPSLKRRISARTTGKWKRQIKKATIPGYGRKGAGYIKNPKKAVYNKVYNKTTVKSDSLLSLILIICFLPLYLIYAIPVMILKKIFSK